MYKHIFICLSLIFSLHFYANCEVLSELQFVESHRGTITELVPREITVGVDDENGYHTELHSIIEIWIDSKECYSLVPHWKMPYTIPEFIQIGELVDVEIYQQGKIKRAKLCSLKSTDFLWLRIKQFK